MRVDLFQNGVIGAGAGMAGGACWCWLVVDGVLCVIFRYFKNKLDDGNFRGSIYGYICVFDIEGDHQNHQIMKFLKGVLHCIIGASVLTSFCLVVSYLLILITN